jgi:hypothetical protein
MATDQSTKTLETAAIWISRGWKVLPCQPDTKRMIAGFGANLNSLSSQEDLEYWFYNRAANLAVLAPDDGAILDFDIPEVFTRFLIESSAAGSYTEFTPGGGTHVFLRLETGSSPRPRGETVNGLEVKRVCLVYPSTVQGKGYKPLANDEILIVNLENALHGFVTMGDDNSRTATTAPVLGLPVGKYGQNITHSKNRGVLAKVKANWTITAYLHYFEPKLVLTGRGRWLSGLCPWHGDTRPSLWIDTERNLWGCHACDAHGDVVNWHARRLGTTDQLLAALDIDRYEQYQGVKQ